jgi:hypothetical protein
LRTSITRATPHFLLVALRGRRIKWGVARVKGVSSVATKPPPRPLTYPLTPMCAGMSGSRQGRITSDDALAALRRYLLVPVLIPDVMHRRCRT